MTLAEAQSHFTAYADAFERRDIAAVAAAWCFPCYITDPSGGFAFRDADAFRRNLDRMAGFYDAQGVAHAEATVTHVDARYAGVATVHVDYRFANARGETLIAWPTDYTLRRGDDGTWKACFAIADGEVTAWAARGTPMGAKH
jgi:ketosteroid isomerase-like protein